MLCNSVSSLGAEEMGTKPGERFVFKIKQIRQSVTHSLILFYMLHCWMIFKTWNLGIGLIKRKIRQPVEDPAPSEMPAMLSVDVMENFKSFNTIYKVRIFPKNFCLTC
ncbi:uncharacterized protein [Elaeis guineensis]|uniref:uncharacterized protein isoform X3 n=1 Tax=Elaeis guineensis var. tenera TaxID=51953 RepID=UPI003C6CFC09